jgi:hypothetical protein
MLFIRNPVGIHNPSSLPLAHNLSQSHVILWKPPNNEMARSSWLSLLNGLNESTSLLVLEMESGQQRGCREVKNSESDAKSPDSFSLKAVSLAHASPRLKSDRRAWLADIVFDVLQDVATEILEGIVAVEAGNWAPDGDRDNHESDEDEEVGTSHDEHANVGAGPVERDADQGVEHGEGCLL